MRARGVLLAGALSAAAIPHASGQSVNGCQQQPAENVTRVYFSNGILTDGIAADITARQLEIAYKSTLTALHPDHTYEFTTAYNPSVGFYSDIVEVLNQKMIEEGIANDGLSAAQLLSFIRAGLSVAEIRRRIALIVGINSRIPPLITELLLERLANAMSTAEAEAIAGASNVGSLHANYYVSDLQAGKRVFVVAHSQGNLFTNASLAAAAGSLPNAANSLAMIGVATPASSQFRGSFYVTAHDDRVIDALRLIGAVLPSNLENDPGLFGDFRSFTNHYFGQDYFDARLASRGQINGEMLRLAAAVPFPTLQAGEGAIRATLTWDNQPDVDLHTYEPNGAHVYYQSTRGPSGTLDVDDTDGFGPENYFVACEKVEAGTYRIGVNYYAGSAPSTATVSLFLGDGRTPAPKTVTLGSARGSAGNNSPSILFTVGVSFDANGRVQYSVQ